MSRYPNSSKAERFGRWLGKNCRKGVNQERRLWNWLRAKQVPTAIVFLLSWSVRIALLMVFFYLSFWIVLVVVVAVTFSLLPIPDVRPFGHEDQDHRLSGFYDPIDYNDDPDSRFDDE